MMFWNVVLILVSIVFNLNFLTNDWRDCRHTASVVRGKRLLDTVGPAPSSSAKALSLVSRWKDHHKHLEWQEVAPRTSPLRQAMRQLLPPQQSWAGHPVQTTKPRQTEIGSTGRCPSGSAQMTGEHLLQHCPLHDLLRCAVWKIEVSLKVKLHSSVTALEHAAVFVRATGVSSDEWAKKRKETQQRGNERL